MARKRKRNYEEVTNGVSRTIPEVPAPPAEHGLEERRIEPEQLSEPELRDRLHSIEWSADGELHQTNSDPDCWTRPSDAFRFADHGGRDNRSMGDNQNTGCDSDSSGLQSSDQSGEELDNVETNLHNGNNVPLRAGLGTRYPSEAKDGGGRTGDLRDSEHRELIDSTGVSHRNTNPDYGMTVDDCIHAMKVIASMQNIATIMSAIEQYDTTITRNDLLESYEELEDRITAFITSCEQRLDTLTNPGG